MMASLFARRQALTGLLIIATQYITGFLVRYRGARVNYTRKINHFVVFLAPLLFEIVFPAPASPPMRISSLVINVLIYVIYIEPFRKNRIIATMFASFDRVEDRPHTLRWLVTQSIVGYAILAAAMVVFDQRGLLGLVSIPVLINGFGDGLAEPVGIRFGKHKYRVRALFTSKKYVRSLEGSACVFVSSIVILLLFRNAFSETQLAVALATIPPLMTLAEAVAPHTWDTPFLFLVGYLALYGVVLL